MRAIKFVFFTLSGFFAIVYFLAVFYVYFNQEQMVFKGSRLAKDYKFTYNQNFEELNIRSFDGNKLNGLLFKAKKSKGLVFYLHGNAGNLSHWGDISRNYTDLDYDIFILDYRGFGKSEGQIEDETQVLKDVAVAYKSLLKRYEENKVIIVGYSIGTGPAAYLASKNSPKSLILQAPYYSFTELSSDRVPFMPNFLKKFTFETASFVTKIKAPIYIFHGNQDQVISYSNSERLYKLIKGKGEFFTMENQGHLNINENETFLNQLKIILNK
jgi:uncharacterized protein